MLGWSTVIDLFLRSKSHGADASLAVDFHRQIIRCFAADLFQSVPGHP